MEIPMEARSGQNLFIYFATGNIYFATSNIYFATITIYFGPIVFLLHN